MSKPNETSPSTTEERTSKASEVRIHDAEGVRVRVGDEIEMRELADPSVRRYGFVKRLAEDRVAIRWIRWDEGPNELPPRTFGDFCRVCVEEPSGEPEPATFEVGDGATVIGWSDRLAGTIVEASAKRVVWQEDKATLLNRDELTVTPGGFAAHVSGVQSYEYERDEHGGCQVYTLRRNGRWVEKGARMSSDAHVVPGRSKHHDFNF